MNYKKILKVAGVVAVAAFFCVGCGGDNGTGKEPDKPDIPDTPNSGGNPSGTTFQDSRDSTTYNKVTIGTQVWMAEYLNYDVPNVDTDVCYNNSADSCAKYGRLYNWDDANSACPSGWHLPSDAEWTRLTDFVGASAGKKLKSTSGWNDNGNGTNQYGFSALPGGYGLSDGSFYDAGAQARWWSSTEYDGYYGSTECDACYAWDRLMIYMGENVIRYYSDKTYLYSVRCVED